MNKRLYILAILLLLGAVLGVVAQVDHPPASGGETPFTFAVFGDNRPGGANDDQPEAFKAILAKMSEMQPAFALNTGDCILGSSSLVKTKAQYAGYVKTVEPLFTPKIYLAVGNHEMKGGKDAFEFFARETGAPYYSFDSGNSHFIALHSNIPGESGRITGDQLDWLKKDLEKSRAAAHKFVFLHEPLYPVDGHKGSSLDQYPKDRDALHSLFVRNRITAVFVGHEHLFHEEVRNGVRYIITGGGGAGVYPSAEGTGDFHHFVLVTISGDKVEMKVVKIAQHGRPEEILPIGEAP